MPYINEPGYEVPENTVAFYPYRDLEPCNNELHDHDNYDINEVVESLIGNPNRDWFTYPFTFCLPLTIANQYGFVIKAAHDIELYWTGGDGPVHIKSEGFYGPDEVIQGYNNNFGAGVMSIENKFILRTPPGVNVLVMPPPNKYIDGIFPLTGVVEADNLRRTFTFNIKVTTPNKKIYIKKGDWLASFILIPRYFVENFKLVDARDIYPKEVIDSERIDMEKLLWERFNQQGSHTHEFGDVLEGGDLGKPNDSGRRYFKGLFPDNKPFPDHQKRITDGPKNSNIDGMV